MLVNINCQKVILSSFEKASKRALQASELFGEFEKVFDLVPIQNMM